MPKFLLLMGFVYRVLMNSKSSENNFVWNHQYFEKIAKKIWDAPEKFTIGLCTYLHLVVVHCWTLTCHINWFKRFEVVFFMSGVIMLHLKKKRNFIQIHQYYIAIALRSTMTYFFCGICIFSDEDVSFMQIFFLFQNYPRYHSENYKNYRRRLDPKCKYNSNFTECSIHVHVHW